MFLKVAIIIGICAIVSIECKRSYVINGPGWKNEIKKCASGGDDSRTYDFHIGELQSTGFQYDDLNSTTIIKALGDFLLHTRSSDDEREKVVYLTNYMDRSHYKQFSKTEKTATQSGWARQTVAYGITVTIHRGGLIELKNYVYAGSWGAVSCAWTEAFVNAIEILN